MNAVTLGLLAAFTNGIQAVINKGLTELYPARQLIGPLYLLNCLVLLPFAPWAAWTWNPTIIVLHLVSVGLMVITAIAVWDLFDKGAASSTTTASALSPIPAAIGTALFLPGSLDVLQVVAAVIVMAAVLYALVGAFGDLSTRGTAWRVLAASVGNGLLTVATKLLVDEGVGVVEIYVVRTALAGLILIPAFPPRGIPMRAMPLLTLRSILVTISFVFIILGVQQGSPVVVQTLVATTPLFALVFESLRAGTPPPRRALVAAAGTVVGVVIVLLA